MAIPGAHALCQQGFEIDWVCGATVSSLLQCYSWINVIPINEKAIFFGTPWQRVTAICNLWRKIGLKKYDLCATLYYDSRYRVLTLPFLVRKRIIFSHDSRKFRLIAGRHHSDEYARILLDLEDGYREQSVSPALPDRLPQYHLSPKASSGCIAIVPGGINHLIREQASSQLPDQALRRWPTENFVAVAKHLQSRNYEVVLLGSPDDTWVRSHFDGAEVTDLIGKLSLPEVVSVCNECDAVITPDTGPLHLAGLSRACVIGIFGPTDPATRVPRRSSVVGIWGGQGFACRPCYDGHDFAPCRFNGCMHQVSPGLVIRELERLLDERSKGSPRPWRVVSPEGT